MSKKKPLWKKIRAIFILLILGAIGISAYVLYERGEQELKTSLQQATYFHNRSKPLSYSIKEGPSEHTSYPKHGPLNKRRGYTKIPKVITRLQNSGFEVKAQALHNPKLATHLEQGFHLPFELKQSAGLSISDIQGNGIYQASYPEATYTSAMEIPDLVVKTLLFLENRELLDNPSAEFNFVVEWDRLTLATSQWIGHKIGVSKKGHGASTLATQIEKFNHSPKGRTSGASDKYKQMYSALLKMYHEDPFTTHERDQVVVTYLNQFPLAAAPGWGEVHGLSAGLNAWYGIEIDEVNQALSQPSQTETKASHYRHVVSLLIALRAPVEYLMKNRQALEDKVDQTLKQLARHDIIPERLAFLALKQRLKFRDTPYKAPPRRFVKNKEVDALRASLGALVGERSFYDLDHTDLKAQTTLDQNLQERVEDLLLTSMKDPKFLEERGFLHPKLLGEGDPQQIEYSFLLYERTGNVNKLRAMVDTLQEPFNLNESAKLDLGSTSKLRTLITYMETIANLHERYAPMSRKELAKVKPNPRDRLTWWVIRELWQDRDMTLEEILEEALDRKYRASPYGHFITGGGIHRFSNFSDRWDDYKVPVWRATQHSVNLVFVRMMRDLVWHYRWDKVDPSILSDKDHPKRADYLRRWVDQDAKAYIDRYWPKYKDVTGEDVLEKIAQDRKLSEYDIAAIYRYIKPSAPLSEMKDYTMEHLRRSREDDIDRDDTEKWEELYEQHAFKKFDLNDRGYISEVHPLEIWLAGQRYNRPDFTLEQAHNESQEVLGEVYKWILEKGSRRAQNNRILTLLEQDAFDSIWKQWHKIGYPFDRLIPSLSTALGASADRPDAIAKMMGILAADGVDYPEQRFDEIVLAPNTPYETRLARDTKNNKGTQVIRPEVATAIRGVLKNVVRRGTAARARSLVQGDDSEFDTLWGKTGTGDHVKKSVNRWGQVQDTESVSRTGVFAFSFDKNYFGIMTLYVDGKQAENYEFTSSTAVKIFKQMGPLLEQASQRRERSMIANMTIDPKPEAVQPVLLQEPSYEYQAIDYAVTKLTKKFSSPKDPKQERKALAQGKKKQHAALNPAP